MNNPTEPGNYEYRRTGWKAWISARVELRDEKLLVYFGKEIKGHKLYPTDMSNIPADAEWHKKQE